MWSVILAAGLAAGSGSCGCVDVFNDVVEATETSYAGYRIKLPDEDSQAAYERFVALLREDAGNADDPAHCRRLLDAYLAFFDDRQLFVTTPTPGDDPAVGPASPAVPARVTAAPDIPNLATRWTPGKVKFRLRREDHLDPVEGLWRDDEGEFAIVSDDAVEGGEYVAFRFSYRYGTRPGEIFAFVRPAGDGTYNIHYKDDADVWQRARGTLNPETGILAFGAVGWQRTTEPASDVHRVLDPFAQENHEASEDEPVDRDVSDDPLAPVFRDLGDGVLYLSLPSFAPRFAGAIETILAGHGKQLASARGLIVDLRGNAGGGADYRPLLETLLTGPIRLAEASAVLASPGNLEHVRQRREALGKQGAHLDAVIARMQANPGEIVPYLDARTLNPAPSVDGPAAVVVLQDRGTGGEAEAFLWQARQSGKVVTMGEASQGAFDYREPVTRTLGCGAYAIDFGYPLVMRTRNLPADSIDDSGLAPDVRLAPVLGDWIDYAERWLRHR